MSKAILVMDMPTGCENCTMAKTRHSTQKDYCVLTDKNLGNNSYERQEDCPLIIIPEEKKKTKQNNWKGVNEVLVDQLKLQFYSKYKEWIFTVIMKQKVKCLYLT